MKTKTMTVEQRTRLDFEFRILKRYVPTFKMLVSNGDIFVEGVVTTQSGREYLGRLILPDYYPDEEPAVLLVHPRPLPMRNGGQNFDSLGSSGSFCLRGPDADGNLVLCAFTSWDLSKSCSIAIAKIALWCEGYENYLKTGETISVYLSRLAGELER